MIDKRTFNTWYLAGAVVILLALQSFFGGSHVERLPYSDFKALLKGGKVQEAQIDEELITGKVSVEGAEALLSPEQLKAMRKTGSTHEFSTVRVADPALVSELEAAKVRFAGKQPDRLIGFLMTWMLPALLLYLLWSFSAKRMSGAHGLMEIGRSKAKVYMERETGVTFEDVAGIDEAKAELMEVVDFLKNPDRYRRLGGKIPKGVLLVGSPGTGKTLLAKAVAGEAAVPFFSLSGSEFVEMFVGVGAARVRDLFERAAEKAPCIVFIDELDALGKARGLNPLGSQDEREQTLNQLLVEMDGFATDKNIIIMAATNRPETLDPALLRPGRFDRQVALDRPDLSGRAAILKVHVRHVTLAPDVALETIGARTPGFAGADLANLVNEAALRAARRGADAVTMQDFDEALDRIVAGLERKSRIMNPEEKRTVAYHETGHAIIAASRKSADPVTKVSIIPRGIAGLGYTRQTPLEDRYLLRRSEMLDRLDVLLGGRVAEEVVFEDASTGAADDLRRATDLARHMVMHYGMSERLGLMSCPESEPALALPGLAPSAFASVGPQTSQDIDAEVRRLLQEAAERVRTTLSGRRAALDAIAQCLLEKEVIDGAEMKTLLDAANTPKKNLTEKETATLS